MARRYLYICILGFMMLVLVSCGTKNEGDSATAPPIIPREKIEYATHIVELGDIFEEIRKTGIVVAAKQHELSFSGIDGVLVEYDVTKNQQVSAGEVLAVIENEELSKQITAQRRSVEMARITYDSALRGRDSAKESLAGQKEPIKIEKQLAEQTYSDAQKSYKAGDISSTQMKEAEATYRRTITRLDQELSQLENAVKNSEDGCQMAKLTLDAETESLSKLEVLDKGSSLRSPIDGIIIFYKSASLGYPVTPDEVLITVADVSDCYIIVRNAEDLSEGDKVRMEFATLLKNKSDWGTLIFEGEVLPSTGELLQSTGAPEGSMLIKAEELPEEVSVGASLSVFLVQDQRYNVVVVPSNAVTKLGDYSYVRVLEDGVPRERGVETGLETGTEIEITAGLEPGEEIIVK